MSGGEIGGSTAMEKQSVADDVEFLWNVWEVHFLILASLSLQVFLFLFAGMRKSSTSGLLRCVLWLAYLSADSVAIFVLGHLGVRASKSGHHLMHFWAPFVLVHLGGQDTITAFSKQDNELWSRHLLTLVTQAAMAGYVVAKESWPDRRLRAAMVIVFLSGCFRYAERTLCLLFASPDGLKIFMVDRRYFEVGQVHKNYFAMAEMIATLDTMSKGSPIFWKDDPIQRIPRAGVFSDILSVDPPSNRLQSIVFAGSENGMLKDFLSNANRHRAYQYVGAWLVYCYLCLYTKFGLRLVVHIICGGFIRNPQYIVTNGGFAVLLFCSLVLLYVSFHYVSAPIALLLFWAAEKNQPHTASTADITVSYILLVGALVLDVSSTILFLLQYMSIIPGEAGRCRSAILRAANKMKLLCHCEKQWSQDIHQYNFIESRAISPARSRSKLCASIVALREVRSISIPRDGKSPIQEFILDNLLSSGIRKEWNIASSRGKLAIQKWMYSHQDPDSAGTTGKALEDSISCDFPISVLIWHIATDMCYYVGDKTSTDPEKSEKHKQISRELSNYIMYLIFKCGVTFTVDFQVVLENTHEEITAVVREIEITEYAVRKLFEANAKKKDSAVVEIQKHEEQANDTNGAAGSHVQELLQRAEAIRSPLLPHAYQVARELLSINDESDRWELIASVWAEMLYYIAPRCGASFHYEHLSTGGEFITHVLFLMYFLGPFLPPTGAGAS